MITRMRLDLEHSATGSRAREHYQTRLPWGPSFDEIHKKVVNSIKEVFW